MARVAKEEDRIVKQNEILDAAQQLVYTQGYEQMSIQDVIDALQISKGAFYHYYSSKQALLDGLVERMLEQAIQLLQPIVQDPALTALEKLHCYFATASQWKTAQKSFLLALLRVFYTDQNAILRQKLQAMSVKRVAPMIAVILRQGVAESVFVTTYPDQTSEILMTLLAGMGETWAGVLLAVPPPPDGLERLERLVAAYTEAIEHVLGAPVGALTLIDKKTIQEWATVA